MKKLLYTKNIGYRMADWKSEPIDRVYAGTNCIMAVTEDGRTLQKTVRPELAVRTAYWTRISQISVSAAMSCMAIGLVSDGTCLIAKRALRNLCRVWDRSDPFDVVNEQVKSWRNIVQVAASDAYFGLDGSGRVHLAAVTADERQAYAEALEWENVRRIVTGPQDAVFGITEEGRVLCAGVGVKNAHRNLQSTLDGFRDVADVALTGSECERVVLALKDGTVLDSSGTALPVRTLPVDAVGRQVLAGHFYYTVIALNADRRLVYAMGDDRGPVFPGSESPVLSFAVGDCHWNRPFVLAVTE